MAAYMLGGLSSAELTSACQNAFDAIPGKAFANIVKSIAKFVSASTEIVQADIKKSAGSTQHLGASASDAISETRQAQAQALLDTVLTE